MNKFIILLLFLIGCSSTVLKKSPVYPDGTYIHNVTVNIIEQKKTISFIGVMKRDYNKVILTGLTPFNSTLFKITEKLESNEIDLKIYDENLKKNSNNFKKLYSLISKALKADHDDLTREHYLKGSFPPAKTNIKFSPDFKTIVINNHKFSIEIKVEKK
jgi:hypothetical protein